MRSSDLPVRVLLADAIDYAGLFPPAQLDMAGAVSEYASYLESDDAWALGAFVVPAARLTELGAAAAQQLETLPIAAGVDHLWRVSAVFGAELQADMDRVNAFHAAYGTDEGAWWARVDAVELRATTTDAVATAMRIVPDEYDRFVEIPATGDVDALVRAVGDANAFAKIRTGGVAADAFPSPNDVARFLRACVTHGVPFKATAGLHHPLRGEYPLTYAPDSMQGTMYGFLNILLATALVRAGADDGTIVDALEERSRDVIRMEESGVMWRGHLLSLEALAASRERSTRSFGSCSFREPLDDLAGLGFL